MLVSSPPFDIPRSAAWSTLFMTLAACDGSYAHPSPYPVPPGVSVLSEAELVADELGVSLADELGVPYAVPLSPSPFLPPGAVPPGTRIILRKLKGVALQPGLSDAWAPRQGERVLQILPEDLVFAKPVVSTFVAESSAIFHASHFGASFDWSGPSIDGGGLWLTATFDASVPPDGDYVSPNIACQTDLPTPIPVYLRLTQGAFMLASSAGCFDSGAFHFITKSVGPNTGSPAQTVASALRLDGASSSAEFSVRRLDVSVLGFGIKGSGSLIGDCPGNDSAFSRDFVRLGCRTGADCPGDGQCVGTICQAPLPAAGARSCLVSSDGQGVAL